jgi:phosphatidylserine/phosphatidylglycerophosphate/cardiolipin synthase-like enzyme
MRRPLAATALTVALLGAAASGCTTAPPTAPKPAEPTKPTLTLIVEPQAGYQPIYDFISGARVSLDMTMYQLSDAKAQDALKAAAKRGVKVRVLLDSDTAGGGSSTMNKAAYSDLATNGVEVRWAWSGTLWHQKSISRDAPASSSRSTGNGRSKGTGPDPKAASRPAARSASPSQPRSHNAVTHRCAASSMPSVGAWSTRSSPSPMSCRAFSGHASRLRMPTRDPASPR